jgi:predicted nucleotidyltransferase
MLREALEQLIPDLKAAWVYGSVAKETDTAKSDIDVMLVGEKLTLNRVLKFLLPLESKLGRKINPTLYTSTEFKRRRAERDSFVNRVLAQPILQVIGDAPKPSR